MHAFLKSSTQIELDAAAFTRTVALACFLAFAVALFAFYHVPLVWALNADQTRTTSLLLLIPAQTLEAMPEMRSFVEKLANDSEVASAGE